MQVIPLLNTANQSLSLTLDSKNYELTLKEANGIMAASLIIEELEILANIRVVAGTPIIPYRYLENGNFIFLTQNDEIPYYTKFGITQTLIYATQEELDAI